MDRFEDMGYHTDGILCTKLDDDDGGGDGDNASKNHHPVTVTPLTNNNDNGFRSKSWKRIYFAIVARIIWLLLLSLANHSLIFSFHIFVV